MEKLTKHQLLEERREIEKYIAALLRKVKSDFTFDDVKNTIYNETETDDMTKIIAMFDTGSTSSLTLGIISRIRFSAVNRRKR